MRSLVRLYAVFALGAFLLAALTNQYYVEAERFLVALVAIYLPAGVIIELFFSDEVEVA